MRECRAGATRRRQRHHHLAMRVLVPRFEFIRPLSASTAARPLAGIRRLLSSERERPNHPGAQLLAPTRHPVVEQDRPVHIDISQKVTSVVVERSFDTITSGELAHVVIRRRFEPDVFERWTMLPG